MELVTCWLKNLFVVKNPLTYWDKKTRVTVCYPTPPKKEKKRLPNKSVVGPTKREGSANLRKRLVWLNDLGATRKNDKVNLALNNWGNDHFILSFQPTLEHHHPTQYFRAFRLLSQEMEPRPAARSCLQVCNDPLGLPINLTEWAEGERALYMFVCIKKLYESIRDLKQILAK